jgi:hypothetical protein
MSLIKSLGCFVQHYRTTVARLGEASQDTP